MTAQRLTAQMPTDGVGQWGEQSPTVSTGEIADSIIEGLDAAKAGSRSGLGSRPAVGHGVMRLGRLHGTASLRDDGAMPASEDLLAVLPVAVVILDPELRVRFANPAFAQLLGCPTVLAFGRSLDTFLAPASAAMLRAALPLGEGDLAAGTWTVTALRTGGAPLPVTLTLVPGALAGVDAVIATFQDLSEQHRLHARWRDSEQRLRGFAEASSDWMWELDEAGRFTWLSRDWLPWAGAIAVGVLGRSLAQLVTPSGDDGDWRRLEADLAAQRPFRGRRLRLGHHETWIELSGIPFYDPAGRFKGYRGTGSDVTRQVQAVAAASHAERRLREAIEGISDGVVLFDPQDRLMLCNARFLELYAGAADLAVPGTSFAALMRALSERGLVVEAAAAPERWLEERLRRHAAPAEPFEEQLADGRRTRITELAADSGFRFAIVTDITSAPRREGSASALSRGLLERNRQFDAALKHMEQGLAMFDDRQQLTVFNDRYLELLRLAPGAIERGQDLTDVLRLTAAGDDPRVAARDEAVAERLAIAARRERRHLRQYLADGGVLEVSFVPLPEGGLLQIVSDVTDRISTETELIEAKNAAEHANQAKSDFLASMSHELRTPLNAVIGFTEMLIGGYAGALSGRQGEYLTDIHDAARHLLSLISDLLDLAKIEAGRMSLSEDYIDLAALVAGCERLTAPRAQAKGLRLNVDLCAPLPTVHGDERLLRQCLLNLLSNAIKFTEADHEITLSAKVAEGGDLELTVADTGVGMDPSEIPLAMEPFAQIDAMWTRQEEGTGLGLPLTKRFAELHGGSLEIESSLGKGTRAHIRLPANRLVEPPLLPHS